MPTMPMMPICKRIVREISNSLRFFTSTCPSKAPGKSKRMTPAQQQKQLAFHTHLSIEFPSTVNAVQLTVLADHPLQSTVIMFTKTPWCWLGAVQSLKGRCVETCFETCSPQPPGSPTLKQYIQTMWYTYILITRGWMKTLAIRSDFDFKFSGFRVFI